MNGSGVQLKEKIKKFKKDSEREKINQKTILNNNMQKYTTKARELQETRKNTNSYEKNIIKRCQKLMKKQIECIKGVKPKSKSGEQKS